MVVAELRPRTERERCTAPDLAWDRDRGTDHTSVSVQKHPPLPGRLMSPGAVSHVCSKWSGELFLKMAVTFEHDMCCT